MIFALAPAAESRIPFHNSRTAGSRALPRSCERLSFAVRSKIVCDLHPLVWVQNLRNSRTGAIFEINESSWEMNRRGQAALTITEYSRYGTTASSTTVEAHGL